ncbi:hypothetical protein D3C76_1458130 [compost metagenome]
MFGKLISSYFFMQMIDNEIDCCPYHRGQRIQITELFHMGCKIDDHPIVQFHYIFHTLSDICLTDIHVT